MNHTIAIRLCKTDELTPRERDTYNPPAHSDVKQVYIEGKAIFMISRQTRLRDEYFN